MSEVAEGSGPPFRVAVVGAGHIGRAWAFAAAASGHSVAIYDSSPDSVARLSVSAPQVEADMRLAGRQVGADLMDRIEGRGSLAGAVEDADLVIEAVPDMLEIKTAIHLDIARHCGPDAIITSSTSSFPGSTFFQPGAYRSRAMVAHPFNPPHLLPLVEICPTPDTSPDAVDRCTAMMKHMGMRPILLRHETPFFIANRLQAAIIGEAISLHAEGVASAEDIDAAVKWSFGRRLAIMGPFEMMHLNSDLPLDRYFRLGHTILGMTEAVTGPADWSIDAVDAIGEERAALLPTDAIAARRAWRDRSLARLASLLREISEEADVGRVPNV